MEKLNLGEYRYILLTAPFGFAYHRVIFSEKGEPIDYIFLDVNDKFEEFTGLKPQLIINRKVTEVIPNIRNDSFDWIKYYGHLSLVGGYKVFEQHSKVLNRWYKVYAISTTRGYFSTIFFDITKEKNTLLEYEKQKEILNELYRDAEKINEDLMFSKAQLEEVLFERNNLIYELSEAKEKLEQLNNEKDKLFSIIGHDLKSPFSGILGILDLLVSNYDEFDSVQVQEFIQLIHENTKKIYQLIENLLEWSRLQRNLVPFQPETYSIYSLISNNIELQKTNIEKKDITVMNEVDANFEAKFDFKMIDTVVRNLLSNAIKFTPRGGTIKFNSSVEGEMVVISIQDNGIGIPPDMLPVLFKAGAKTSRPGTEGESSTGLGLLLCKEYIEKHNGKIWVESTEGKGTKFYFSLPKG